jgi:uncharacterized membrane protein (DUF106 family)
MSKNWLKYLVAISAIMIAGSAAYFSVTGLSVLFSGAAIAVMVMAGSLEFAKLVTATYLKQEWNSISGVNKWYLTSAVVILMGITSAGIFGYLSNAFQQQNIKLEQVQREVDVWNNKITYANQQITTLQGQQKDLSTTQNTLITKGNVNSRLLRSVDNRDKQSNTVNKKINSLQDSVVVYNGKINDIKNANIDIEREVGGFRFVAEAFGVELKSVVKFFIFLIVIVFDPLAVALVISFNQLVMTKRKDEEEVVKEKEEVDVKEVVDESARLKLSEEDLKKLEEILLNPPPPNEALKNAAKKYEEEVVEKKSIFPEGMEYDEEYNRPVYNTKTEISQEERKEILVDIIKHDEELGLYNEPFDKPMIKEEPKITDDNISGLDVRLMDESDKDWESFEQHWIKQTEEELSTIEPTEEEESRNFSTITPESTNFFQKDEYVPSLSDEEVNEMVLDEWERNLDMDEEQDGIDDQTSDTEKKKS